MMAKPIEFDLACSSLMSRADILENLHRIGHNLHSEGYLNDGRRLHNIGETLLTWLTDERILAPKEIKK